MASSSTILAAARSTRPVVEKSGHEQVDLRADMIPDLDRELVEDLRPRILGGAFNEIISPHLDCDFTLVADNPRSKLFGMGVDVVGNALDDHQPDRVGRQATEGGDQ